MNDNKRKLIETAVKSIKSGDKNSVLELHKLISVAIRHIALKYLHNLSDAEDLVQDFWADIFRIINSYHYNKNAYGYLCKVVRNKAINRYKELNKNVTLVSSMWITDYLEKAL